MRKFILSALLVFALLFTFTAYARTISVRGYYRHNGTYVAPYHRTSPDRTQYDNWSAKGNVNPYTGKIGTKIPRY
jgi:hypothetical protein